MVTSENGDGNEREKMIGEDLGLWTVECLRGRLLAERVASKTAKENVEFMGNKLIELERQLMLEIEAKNEAEKRLKFLIEKMGSLKLSPILHHSVVLEDAEGSSGSSTTSSSVNLIEEGRHGSHVDESIKCSSEGEMREAIDSTLTSGEFETTEYSVTDFAHQSCSSTAESNWSATSRSCHIVEDDYPKQITNYGGHQDDEAMVDDAKQDLTRQQNKCIEHEDDNKLKLVPISIWSNSQFCESRINNQEIHNVLTTLRCSKAQRNIDVIKSH